MGPALPAGFKFMWVVVPMGLSFPFHHAYCNLQGPVGGIHGFVGHIAYVGAGALKNRSGDAKILGTSKVLLMGSPIGGFLIINYEWQESTFSSCITIHKTLPLNYAQLAQSFC